MSTVSAQNSTVSEQWKKPPYAVHKFGFVWLIHLIGIVGLTLLVLNMFTITWHSIALAGTVFIVSSTAITAGYHRLFSHPTYEAHWLLELFFLITGATAFQGSARQWSSQHRDHHTYVDQNKDPYNINMGFWYAHMGWVVRQTYPNYGRVTDLDKNPLIMWQFRNYYILAFGTSFVLPFLLGMLWGNPWGALYAVGVVRLLMQWHMTFCVNSVAHYWGSQKYSKTHTARGSWWLSFITWGEMDHNFHHTFPNDFRTGTRWYDFDPGKWTIKLAKTVGLASQLNQTKEEKIIDAMERAKIQDATPSAQ